MDIVGAVAVLLRKALFYNPHSSIFSARFLTPTLPCLPLGSILLRRSYGCQPSSNGWPHHREEMENTNLTLKSKESLGNKVGWVWEGAWICEGAPGEYDQNTLYDIFKELRKKIKMLKRVVAVTISQRNLSHVDFHEAKGKQA